MSLEFGDVHLGRGAVPAELGEHRHHASSFTGLAVARHPTRHCRLRDSASPTQLARGAGVPKLRSMNSAPDQVQLVQRLVLAMPMARTLGLRFTRVAAGEVELEIPVAPPLTYRPGHLQATPVFAAADFAAVAAAGTLLPPGWVNSTIDATLKLLAPAAGGLIRARGRVIDAGKLLTVCAADVFAVDAQGAETLCATWLGTARNIAPRT
jgi:acyl-coenzyme A thioesterase PaaI-like protein